MGRHFFLIFLSALLAYFGSVPVAMAGNIEGDEYLGVYVQSIPMQQQGMAKISRASGNKLGEFYQLTINIHGKNCVGEVEALGRFENGEFSFINDDKECFLTIKPMQAYSIAIQESKECAKWHGFECSFQGNYERKAIPAPSESETLAYDLPRGISVSLPRDWVVTSDHGRAALNGFSEALTQKVEPNPAASDLLFAASHTDNKGSVDASMNVRCYPGNDLSQADVRKLKISELNMLDKMLEAQMLKEMRSVGISITSWLGTTKINVNGMLALVSEYLRVSLTGPGDFRVRLVRVISEKGACTLTTSYYEPMSSIFRPVTDGIINSLKIDGVGEENSTSSGSQAVRVAPFEGWTWIELLASFLITWGIGLTPPVLIRYVLIRRPLSKKWAIGVSVGFWMINVVLFSALGSQSKSHIALALIAYVSYLILRRKGKTNSSRADGKEYTN